MTRSGKNTVASEAGACRVASWLGLVGAAVALAGCASPLASEGYTSSAVARNYGPRPLLQVVMGKAMSDEDADALIARAIVEHEMRRP